jgi:hypothetical protein
LGEVSERAPGVPRRNSPIVRPNVDIRHIGRFLRFASSSNILAYSQAFLFNFAIEAKEEKAEISLDLQGMRDGMATFAELGMIFADLQPSTRRRFFAQA